MTQNEISQCTRCTVFRCGSRAKGGKVPAFCPTEKYPDLVKESIREHKLPQNRAISLAWRKLMDRVMDPQKPRERFLWTRLDEIIEFARIRRMKRMGIATCYSLMAEARILADILERNAFTVVSVSCLCGELAPRDVDIEGGAIFCNPIMQAEVLNGENTELNIVVGLCLGHDIMFQRYAKAETTTLVVKDRAMGHNPVAALYLSQSYYQNRFAEG
ncbi:MAG: DUF1847 domain-containing protein [Chloroflexota bacterium]